jgi:hypothetical protein
VVRELEDETAVLRPDRDAPHPDPCGSAFRRRHRILAGRHAEQEGCALGQRHIEETIEGLDERLRSLGVRRRRLSERLVVLQIVAAIADRRLG